jgi:hypothetical protein
MYVVAVIDERAHQTRRGSLDAPVEDERARDDEELHWSDDLEAGLDRGWPEIDATRVRWSGCLEAGLHRGWPEIDATRLRTAIFIVARPRAPVGVLGLSPMGLRAPVGAQGLRHGLVASSARC